MGAAGEERSRPRRLRIGRCSRARRASLLFVLVTALVVMGSATRVLASPSSKLVYIRGTGADRCPGEDGLRKAVATRLGYDPFFPSAQKTVVAEVSRTAGGFRGKVQIVGDGGALRGARDLATKGDDCTELVSAMALAISIALDDLDAEEKRQAPPPPAEPPPPPAPPVEPDVAAPAPPPPPAERPKPVPATRADFAMSLGPTLSVGTAPAPVFGGGIVATLGYGAVAARASFRGEVAGSGPLASGGSVSTQTFIGMLEGCLRAGVPFVCVGGGGGSFATETSGITRGVSDHGPIAVVVATVGARLRLGSSFYLEPFAGGAVSLVDERVVVDARAVYDLSRVAGVFGAHFGLQIF